MSVIQFLGSKLKLLDWLVAKMKPHMPPDAVFVDLFAGSGNVSRHFAGLARVGAVIANDTEDFSTVLCRALLTVPYSRRLEGLIASLNALRGRAGLIFKHYSEGGSGGRLFFTGPNGKAIDAMRMRLQELLDSKQITHKEFTFLLASLIASADRVSNGIGMYQTFLKHFKPGVRRPLVLQPIHTLTSLKSGNRVTQGDAATVVTKLKGDVVYIDPPYCSLQYASFYHLLNYLCRYDKSEKPAGVGGIVEGYYRSDFSSRTRCREAFETLIAGAARAAPHVFMSYSNEGLLPKADLMAIMRKYGRV